MSGPALPEAFLRFELAAVLDRRNLLPKSGRPFEQGWDTVRRQVRALGGAGGPLRVNNHVIAPLAPCLGYGAPQRQELVATREGMEEGGWLLHAPGGATAACVVGRHRQRSGRAASHRPRLSFQPDPQRVARAAVLLANPPDC